MSALKTEILSRLSTVRLPALPHVLTKLMVLCQNDNTTISDLVSLIEQEPTITHKILQVANSPAYCHRGQQTKLDQSLITLGTHLVRMLIINESVFQNFNYLPAFQNHDLRFFWLHSLKTAVIARKVARHTGFSNIDEAYLAGLLHDIGRLALLTVVPDLYHDLFYLSDTPDLIEKEQALIGIDHTQVGVHLIREWKFDPAFIDSIATHHASVQPHALTCKLSQLLHLSDQLAVCNPADPAIETIAKNHQFPVPIALQIVADAVKDVSETAIHIGIDITGMETKEAPAAPSPSSLSQQQLEHELASLIQASELGRFFQNSKTAAELQDAALKAAAALFSLNSAILLWKNKESDSYRIIGINQTMNQLLGHPVGSSPQGKITQSFMRKTPEWIAGMDEFSLTSEKNIAKLLGGESWLLLPLAGSNQCPGLIFASISKEKLAQLQTEKYRLIYFGEQFVSAWNRMEETQKTIQSEIALAEEKHRHFSSEIANEINNPLAVIRNYLFILNRQLDEKAKEKEAISILNEEIDRLSNLVSEMSNPAYFQKARAEKTDIKPLVQDVIALFHETGFIPGNIQIITHASSVLPEKMEVSAPENLLKQIMINLVKHAIKTMPNGGSIMITHKNPIEQEGKKYHALSIKDSGSGIPQEILENLFSPLTTTKEKNHQSVGLSIVYSLLNKIEALISCQSNTNGTTFDLLIPAFTAEER